MRLTERKCGIVKVLSPAMAFIVLQIPKFAHLVKPDFKLEIDKDYSEQLIRLELVKRNFSDNHHFSMPLEDYEKMMDKCTPDQRQIIDENLISIEKFKRAGFTRIDKGFLDYLGKTNTSPSSRHVPTSNRNMALQEDPHQDNDYVVTADERTLLTYLFPTSVKNMGAALDCVEKLIEMNQSMTYRNLQKLGEMFGVESDPLWQAFLKTFGKESVSPREQRQFSSDQIRDALEKARQDISHKNDMLSNINKFAQLAWEQDEKDRARMEEEQRIAEEQARIAQEAEERRLIEEQERLEKEDIKRKIAVAMQAARKRAAEEEELNRIENLKAKFMEE